ncbi:NAD-dependent epimerase [Pseudahrensia aquimaris]|uniref:NAD-dependent epimerase n=1 Tax=Pseudahrensia aquimaris TaxID=744461 RepID=A0ABW3FG88_9HYPH
MKILVTGVAGFVGAHVARALLAAGHDVVGLDDLNNYYDPTLKQARLDRLIGRDAIEFHEISIANRAAIDALFAQHRFDRVIHLAAQAGVRYSLENPQAYGDSNLTGFLNIVEACRQAQVAHLVFASSSSVYGANANQPFSPHTPTEHPLSLYAATKKANEMMAHSYAHLYGLPLTGLRFFTVYGPWGRPDMAYFSFTQKILAGETIDVFNQGQHARDFTYIDDIVEGVVRVADHIPHGNQNWDAQAPDTATSTAPYRIFNIGNSKPVPLMEFIETLEAALGKKAIKNFLPMQPGDVESTSADVSDLRKAVGFSPDTPLADGIAQFVDWYRGYFKA